MPVYQFQCALCGELFEKNLPFSSDLSQVICPNGHIQVQRVYKAPPVMFKGSGYYITDKKKPS